MTVDPQLTQLLQHFFAKERPEARRIFHGRGQCYPGLESLCIDWFSPIVLISAFAPVEEPKALREAILAADVHKQITSIVLQQRHQRDAPAECIHGTPLASTIVKEGSLRFEVQPGARQNAGLFLDTRLLRDWLLRESAGANVLNLFAYTCTLSVAALAGGAEAVTNVDMSRTCIEWGLRNHRLNLQDPDLVNSIPHNLFRSWGRIRQFGRYDLVIVDPPTRQRGSFDAERDYSAVLKQLPKLCKPGARVVLALNSPFLDRDFLTTLCEKRLPGYRTLETIPPAPEFKEVDADRGLKMQVIAMPDEAVATEPDGVPPGSGS